MYALAQFLFGALFGAVLSRTRSGLGGGLTTWTGLDAHSTALWSVFALLLGGIVVRTYARGPRLSALWGLPLGYAVHAFLGTASYGMPMLDVLLFMPLLVVLGLAAKTKVDARLPQPKKLELVGLFLAAAGVAVALACVGRHARLLGDGSTGAASAHGVVLLLLMAVGASAFTMMLISLRTARLASYVALALAASSCLLSLSWLDSVSTQRGLAEHLERFGLDFSWRGTWRWDALLAASAYALPALSLGVALHALRGKYATGVALVGGAVGLLLVPELLAAGDPTQDALSAAQWIPLAVWVTCAGAALAALAESKERTRWFAVAPILGCAALVAIPTVKPVVLLAPWSRRPVIPYLAADAAVGFATVEPGDGGLKIATVERRLVTPNLDDAGEDMARLRTSVALVPQAVRAARGKSGEGLRVLFVGQLTALRWAALRESGVTSIDRTAAWHDLMPRMELALFELKPEDQDNLPAGFVLEPGVAWERYHDGQYDLVICPAILGEFVPVHSLTPMDGTTVVRWLDGDAPLPEDLPDAHWNGSPTRVLLVQGRGLESLQCAHVVGGEHTPESPWTLWSYAEDGFEDAPRADELLRRWSRPALRGAADRGNAYAAFEAAQGDGTGRTLCEAGRAFASAQVVSSPYETQEEQVELPDEVLQLLTRAGATPRVDAYARSAIERAAAVLVGKRDVQRLTSFATPLAAQHAPWPALEIALAHADLESLDAEGAVARLKALAPLAPRTVEYHGLYALALEEAGDRTGAVSAWRAALALQPEAHNLQRSLAAALVRNGDPEGRRLVEALLQEHPEDEALRAYLGPGPWPSLPRGGDRH
jgi:Flp pilus assembly protein TadD